MKDSKEKYVICTEKDLYRQDIRRIPGIPLIYLNRSVLTLDQPSKNSDHFVDSVALLSNNHPLVHFESSRCFGYGEEGVGNPSEARRAQLCMHYE